MRMDQITEAKYAFQKTAADAYNVYKAIASEYDNSDKVLYGGITPPHNTLSLTRYQHLYPDQTKPHISTSMVFLVYKIDKKEIAIRKVKEIVDRYNAPYHSINGYKQPNYWYITVSFRECI